MRDDRKCAALPAARHAAGVENKMYACQRLGRFVGIGSLEGINKCTGKVCAKRSAEQLGKLGTIKQGCH